MGEIISIVDLIRDNGSDFASYVILFALVLAVAIGLGEYKGRLWRYITHHRNKWNFTALLLFAAMYGYILKTTILPLLWVCGLVGAWTIYCIVCFISLKPKPKYSNPILKQFRRYLDEGTAAENVDFFRKDKHWFFLDIDEQIEYQLLRSSYLAAIGDFAAGYKALCSIKTQNLYEEEMEQINLRKALLLSQMGSFRTAYTLLGEPENNRAKNPVVWIAYSYYYEHAGDIDKAIEVAGKAKNLVDLSELAEWEKANVYNDYARILLMRGNNLEAIRYYRIAYEKAKKSKDMRTVQVLTSNLVMQMAIGGVDHSVCEKVLNEYHDRIETLSINNALEYNNCQIAYFRQIGNERKVYDLIRDGYYELKDKLNTSQRELLKASTFRMTMNGHYVHDWFDAEICTDSEVYMALDLPERLVVFKEYIGVLQQEEFRAVANQEPYAALQKLILKYYNTDAIREIDEYSSKLESYEVLKHKEIVMQKLGILKLIEKHNHIESSKQIYLDLARALFEEGLHIDATNVLLIFIDECASPYNIEIQLQNWPSPVCYGDFIDHTVPPPNPLRNDDGIHLEYYRISFTQPPSTAPLYTELIREHLERIISEYDSWQNHPVKIELSVHIAHMLMCLNRQEEASRFYEFFKNSNISSRQFASWFCDEIKELDKVFGT